MNTPRTKLIHVIPLPSGGRKLNHRVRLYSNDLDVNFHFRNKQDARLFLVAAIRSASVTYASLHSNGKFMGGRDGAGN